MRFYYAQVPRNAVETRGGESFLAGVATLDRDTSITAVNIDLASAQCAQVPVPAGPI
jgi:hypothetical protein